MSLRDAKDHGVFTSLQGEMQKISIFARHGYTRYIDGEVPLTKAVTLVDKFIRKYDIHLDSTQAYRARKKGKAVGRLLLWRKNENTLYWLLMLSRGELLFDDNEKWKDQRKQKISIMYKNMTYELCQVHKEQFKKTVWTWKVKRDDYNLYMTAAFDVIQHRHHDLLKPMIQQLSTDFLGFSASRDQAKKAKDLIERAWRRSNGNAPPPHPFPEKFFYLRRVKDKVTTLRKLLEKHEQKN